MTKLAGNFLKEKLGVLTRPQKSILSAATIIMVMVAVSRFLGLIRNRVLAFYFSADELSVYLAAFRLPEVFFEILVFGTLSSAFMPTLTGFFASGKKKDAWYVAAVSLNFAFLLFVFFALIVFFFAEPLYRLIAPGFSFAELEQTAFLARFLIFAQAFFLLSYFLTAILESLKRFFLPAVAPLFYNLGIILGTVFWARHLGLLAPALGAVFGAAAHFLIQLPLAWRLGFRPRAKLDFHHPGVREIGRLSLPRLGELAFLQVSKSMELLLSSLVGSGAYTYFTFAQSLQVVPVSLFGSSIAKASLPTLSAQAAHPREFQKTFLNSFNQVVFLTVPFALFLSILRVPMVRLLFGTARFDWVSTVQTSYVLSAFSLSIPFQSLVYLLNRAFYSLHDTLTPTKLAIGGGIVGIALGFIFILGFHLPVWSLALASSFAAILQVIGLLFFLQKKQAFFSWKEELTDLAKVVFCALLSGLFMYPLLKILDRSVWDKGGYLSTGLFASWGQLALDTRSVLNLIVVSGLVGVVGAVVYLLSARLLKAQAYFVFKRFLERWEKLFPWPNGWRQGKRRETVIIDDSSEVG